MSDEKSLGQLMSEAWASVSDTNPTMFVASNAETMQRALGAVHEALRTQQLLLVAIVGRLEHDAPPVEPVQQPAAEQDESMEKPPEVEEQPAPQNAEEQGRQAVQEQFKAITASQAPPGAILD